MSNKRRAYEELEGRDDRTPDPPTPPPIMQPASLIAFYEHRGPDPSGRMLDDIMSWSDEQLDISHNYIQTLFPLPETSNQNIRSAIIDEKVFTQFRSEKGSELRNNLRESLKKMLLFFGFEMHGEGDTTQIFRSSNYATNAVVWDTYSSDYHRYITRILRSLRILGLGVEAVAFYVALQQPGTADAVGPEAKEFWYRAIARDLNLPPSLEGVDDGDNSVGLRFLREHELERRAREEAEARAEAAAQAKPVGKEDEDEEAAQLDVIDGVDALDTMAGVEQGKMGLDGEEGEEGVGEKKKEKKEAEREEIGRIVTYVHQHTHIHHHKHIYHGGSEDDTPEDDTPEEDTPEE